MAIQLAVTLASENGAKLTGLHVMPEFHVLAYTPEMLTDTEERFLQVARRHADAVTKAATQGGVECETWKKLGPIPTRRLSVLRHSETVISS